MALVDYSDSEGSEGEDVTVNKTAPPTQSTSKTGFAKLVNTSEPRKLKVNLPSVQPEPVEHDEAPPSKRARTAGTFGGFNSLLPAPKKASVSNAPKAGISLRTSSEAAFSRSVPREQDEEDTARDTTGASSVDVAEKFEPSVEEPKIVGKATKFKPLSVANKKKTAVKRVPNTSEVKQDNVTLPSAGSATTQQKQKEPEIVPPKPKRSLFSVPQEEEVPEEGARDTYQPITQEYPETAEDHSTTIQQSADVSNIPSANSLQSLTSDLNLTPAQRRQLFGRKAKDGDVQIAHFNMENEYAANEQLRQAGEVVEHRAVKAIAPGKHSLQQLVNNARRQQDAMEDKWSQGRRDRGEGGAKYGWSR